MPSKETLEKFITAVETESHDTVIEQFYTDDASIQENQSEPRVGKINLVKNEQKALSQAKSVRSKCIRPFFINGDHVVIRWQFRFNWLDGSTTEMEEIAYQFWKDELIHKETFFYDPIQRQAKKDKL